MLPKIAISNSCFLKALGIYKGCIGNIQGLLVLQSCVYCHVSVLPMVSYDVRMEKSGSGGTTASKGLQFWVNTSIGIMFHYSGDMVIMISY